MPPFHSDINLAKYENHNSSLQSQFQTPLLNLLSAAELPDAGKRTLQSIDAKSQVPSHLAAMNAVAEGYRDYMKYLKNGGYSGVESAFGSLELVD